MDIECRDCSDGRTYYRKYLDGDKEAFCKIIILYRSRLIFFVNNLIHNLSACEDIVEDSFFELIAHPHRYNFSVSLKTYLYSIAHHKAIDYLRSQTRHPLQPTDDMDGIPDPYASLEDRICRKEQNRLLYSAMGRLNEEYRTVLILFYFEDMGYEEVGRVMKKTGSKLKICCTERGMFFVLN